MITNRPLEFIEDKNGCWNCISHCLGSDGYPQKKVDGVMRRVHRIVYEKLKGEIPEGMILRHTCDNRKCSNPDHLLLGTHADNVRDRVERGRSAIGSRNGRAKLNEQKVGAILASAKRPTELAALYGVTTKVIKEIRDGAKWKHVKRPIYHDLFS